MATFKKKTSFQSDADVAEAQSELELLVQNVLYNTQPSFSADSEQYPNNLIPFTEKHMQYLRTHKGIDPRQYIANLRLMTKIR